MKKIFSIFILVAFVATAFAQEREVNLLGGSRLLDITSKKNIAYNGNTSDRLIYDTRDTIDYYVIISNYTAGAPLHFYANFTLDTVAGVDTTVSVTVLEKKFASESYSTLIAAANTSEVTAELQYARTSLGTIAVIDSTGYQNYTASKVNTLLYYRYLKFRLILTGDDYVGTGIKVKRVELQFF